MDEQNHPPATSTLAADALEHSLASVARQRTFSTVRGIPGEDWAEAARQLAHYRLSPTEIASAIDALHETANLLTDAELDIPLSRVSDMACVVGASVALLREQAAIYERLGVSIAADAAEKATIARSIEVAAEKAKPYSDAALTRIGEEARQHVNDYVALLEAERANGETLLRVLRRLHDVRLANGDPEPKPKTEPTKRTQIDLNDPSHA